jgi:3-oxoacyl-(acyl-carrier-protein) synthase
MLELGIWRFPHVAMNNLFVIATNLVTRADLATARLGQRFGRMDVASQLSLLAVEPFASQFDNFVRDRIAIVIAVRAGSLPTDVAYWEGRDQAGGLSPTLFTYTLPSAAIGEIAIRHRLTGPNLCFVGDSRDVLAEAVALLRTDEADAVIAVDTNVISPALTKMISLSEAATACAVLVSRTGPGLMALGENPRDMETLCANLRPHNLTK